MTGNSDWDAQNLIVLALPGEVVLGPFGAYRMTRRGRVRYSNATATITVPHLSRIARKVASRPAQRDTARRAVCSRYGVETFSEALGRWEFNAYVRP